MWPTLQSAGLCVSLKDMDPKIYYLPVSYSLSIIMPSMSVLSLSVYNMPPMSVYMKEALVPSFNTFQSPLELFHRMSTL